jgi:hypothetical protein
MQSYSITGDTQQLTLTFNETKRGYGFTLGRRTDDQTWTPVSEIPNPFVRGPSFDLYASTVEQPDPTTLRVSGRASARGVDGTRLEYAWSGEIRYDATQDWFHCSVNLELPADLELQMVNGFEPELTLEMGALPPYDRGDHVWFKTHVNNPTKWNDEAFGNDMPALYYFDGYHGFEVMMFFDMTRMAWMSRDNIARFLNYRCGFRRAYHPTPSYELGLYADGFSGTRFPGGRQTFAYHLRVGAREAVPTETQALTELVAHCAALLPAASTWPEGATDWEDFAHHTALELMDEQCWGRNDEMGEFVLNYVSGHSPAWEEAFRAKGKTIDFKNSPCIDAATWIGFPLSVVTALRPEPRYAALLERLHGFAGRYARSSASFLRQRGGSSGTWQYLYLLEQFWMFARLNGDQDIIQDIEREIDEAVIPLAHNVGYLFPLIVDRARLKKTGAGDNFAVAGLYAHFMTQLARATGKSHYLDEARAALRVLHNLPLNSLPQEVMLIAAGVQAAAHLHRTDGDSDFAEIRDALTAHTLRLMYWFDDPHGLEGGYRTLGMFDGCTPMLYPAFFENLETLARLAPTFAGRSISTGILRAFNHARKNNFSMFPACLSPEQRLTNLDHIPFENLSTLETEDRTGYVGQEIYGCGQVFQGYLLFEAFGKSSDRDVMVLNLDGFASLEPAQIKRMPLSFVAYNPEPDARGIDLRIPGLVSLEAGAHPDDTRGITVNGDLVRLSLEPDEVVYLRATRS